ncbi:MAG TPA: hypothetical protein V6C81_07675 [Planktothrix sp.]|jgi:hypothetical protein
MANNNNSKDEFPFPVAAGLMCGILGGIVVGLSFWVITFWPLPAAVAPYFGFRIGFVWGAVVGFAFGAILGFLTDDSHFQTPTELR